MVRPLNVRLAETLQRFLPYIEEGYEARYPGEVYERDNYVAAEISDLRAIIAEAQKAGLLR